MTDQNENGIERPNRRASYGRRGHTPEFTFPDSGVTVGLYPVSPDTIAMIHREVTKKNPAPTPKKTVVLVGEAQEPMEEEVQTPEFARELWEHAVSTSQELGRRLFQLAKRQMVFTIDQEALQAWKADMESIEVEIPSDQDDRELYIRNVIITTKNDLDKLMDYFMAQSRPTEAAVDEVKAEFPGQVMG